MELNATALIDDYLDDELDEAGAERLRTWLEADPRTFARLSGKYTCTDNCATIYSLTTSVAVLPQATNWPTSLRRFRARRARHLEITWQYLVLCDVGERVVVGRDCWQWRDVESRDGLGRRQGACRPGARTAGS